MDCLTDAIARSPGGTLYFNLVLVATGIAISIFNRLREVFSATVSHMSCIFSEPEYS